MWSILEKGKELAKKAEAAAHDIDKKINESVGIVETPSSAHDDDDDDALNAAWVDDVAFASDDELKIEPKSKQAPAVVRSVAEENQVPAAAAAEVSTETPLEEPLEESHSHQPLSKDTEVASPKSPAAPLAAETSDTLLAVDASDEAHDEVEQNGDAWAEDDDLLDNVTDDAKEPPTQQQQEAQAAPSDALPVQKVEEAAVDESSSHAVEAVTTTTAAAVQDETSAKELQSNEEIDGGSSPTAANAAHVTAKSTAITEETPKPLPEKDDSSSRTNQELSHQHALLQQRQQELERQLQELQSRLQQREDQLFSKTEQLTTMAAMHDSEKAELQQRIHDTKEEAKRRILKAKERVQAMEAAASSNDDASKQAEIIAALRQEGEELARKQSEMVQAVRTAKAEARELEQELQQERTTKENALETVARLQSELKTTKEDLASARRGESQADKLELELSKAREEGEAKAASILALEQNIKELKSENKELAVQLEEAQKGAAIETEREQKKLLRERNDAVSDLENKLRTSEREAAVREDALRHEVAELRKRWQDAVRRADSLSMDVQSSTAPLLRQLESADRQNRARAAAWTELENSLRAELEENVIANEKLSKERSEWKTKSTRLERAANDKEAELKSARSSLEEKTHRLGQLEEKLETMEVEGSRMKEEWAEVERLANEGVSRVRSEMTQTIVENEERHQSQLDSLQSELREEHEKCLQLQRQLDELVEKSGLLIPQEVMQPSISVPDDKPKKLVQSMDQVDILTGALNGLGDSRDDEQDDDDIDDGLAHNDGTRSCAALAELTSRLKSTNVELNTLRQSLMESEKSRETMVEELAEARNAKEKLPLFESRVQELTSENEEMSLEIQSLQLDITEVRELYRTQLNVLLEEKASRTANATNGGNEKTPSTSIETETPLSDS